MHLHWFLFPPKGRPLAVNREIFLLFSPVRGFEKVDERWFKLSSRNTTPRAIFLHFTKQVFGSLGIYGNDDKVQASLSALFY